MEIKRSHIKWVILVLLTNLILTPVNPVYSNPGFPSIRDFEAIRTINSNGHTVQYPSTVEAGDTLLAFMVTDDNEAVTWPGEGVDWHIIYEEDAGSAGPTLVVAWKKAIGDEDGTWFSVTTGSSEASVQWCFAIQDAGDPTINPPEASTEASGSSSAPNSLSLTPGGGSLEYLWFSVSGSDDGRDEVTGYPANMPDNNAWVRSADQSGGAVMGVSTEEYEGISLNPDAFTLENSEQWECVTVAVYPVVVADNPPVNDRAIISDFDDSDNLYAERKYYSLEYDGTDPDGYANIDYILVNITQAGTLRATFKYDEDLNTFSLVSGDWEINAGGSSANRVDTYINATFLVTPAWDATQESDFDINATIIDAQANADRDWLQTDYGDVITTLVTNSIECTDADNPDRVSVDSSQTVNFGVRYENNPGSATASAFYPPDAEFTSISVYDQGDHDEGADATIVNGEGQVTGISEASVESENYNLYVNMDDADYTDGELTTTETIIWDRILFYYVIGDETDNRTDINDDIEIRVRGLLEYDDHGLGAGDSVSVNASGLAWDAPNTWFDGLFTEPVVGNYSFIANSATEATYTITAVNQNVSYYAVFDLIQVYWNVNDTTPENTKAVNFTIYSIIYDFDNVELTGYTYDAMRNASLFLDDYTHNNFTDSNSDTTYNYTLVQITEPLYGLTVFWLNVTTYNVTWAPVIVYPVAPNLLYGAGFNGSPTGYILLLWNHSGLDVTDYELQNSTDGITWDTLAIPATPNYNDTSAELINGTYRHYQVRARNLISGDYYNSSWSVNNTERVHFLTIGGVGGPGQVVEGVDWLPISLILSMSMVFLISKVKR